jgi:formylmethanofuran dehydrogenase subunit E
LSVVTVSKGGNVVKARISEEDLKAVIAFHGHWCPGLATGIRVSEIALEEFGKSSDEEIVAVAESDNCAVDAVQFLTGCSVGKGNLILSNIGKMAFSFYRRSDGKALRIVSRSNVARGTNDEYRNLQEKKNAGSITEEETARLQELRREHCTRILESDINDLFVLKEPPEPVPPFAPMKKSLVCDECGEVVMETRVRLSDGRALCSHCFESLVPRP